jgi:hypothetical protein
VVAVQVAQVVAVQVAQVVAVQVVPVVRAVLADDEEVVVVEQLLQSLLSLVGEAAVVVWVWVAIWEKWQYQWPVVLLLNNTQNI